MRRYSPFRLLAPAGAGGRLSIFIFHRVLDRPDPMRPSEPDAQRFERIVAFITRNFQVLALADAVDTLARGRLPAAAACITFDDGYADNLTVAAPILRRHGASATVFVATAFIDGGRTWNDSIIEAVRAAPQGELNWRDFGLGCAAITDDASRLALIAKMLAQLKYLAIAERAGIASEIARRAGLGPSSDLMLSRRQLLDWRDLGFDVGGHTVNHPILARLNDVEASAEIGDGRAQLTEWLGVAPRVFAYPNGMPGRDYGERDVALVKRAGYGSAVSTARGVSTQRCDRYQLPRFTPWDRSMWAFGLRCAQTIVGTRRAAATQSDRDNTEVHT